VCSVVGHTTPSHGVGGGRASNRRDHHRRRIATGPISPPTLPYLLAGSAAQPAAASRVVVDASVDLSRPLRPGAGAVAPRGMCHGAARRLPRHVCGQPPLSAATGLWRVLLSLLGRRRHHVAPRRPPPPHHHRLRWTFSLSTSLGAPKHNRIAEKQCECPFTIHRPSSVKEIQHRLGQTVPMNYCNLPAGHLHLNS